MTRKRKIALMIAVVLLACASLVAGTALYMYTHPARVKSLMEKTLSDKLGASVSLRHLTYRFHPFHIKAEGLRVTPGNGLQGVYIDAPDFRADLALKGPFARRTLVVERLEVRDFSCRIRQGMGLPDLSDVAGSGSPLSALVKPLIAFFLFRDISFQQVRLSGGTLRAEAAGQTLHVSHIDARLSPAHRVEISCGLNATWPAQQVRLSIPEVHLHTDPGLSLSVPHIKGTVTGERAVMESPFAKATDLQAKMSLVYRDREAALDLETMDVVLPAVRIKHDGASETIPLDLHVTGSGRYGNTEGRLMLRPLHLAVSHALQLTGEMKATIQGQKEITLTLEKCRVIPEQLLRLVPSRIRAPMIPLKMKGPVKVVGNVSAMNTEADWTWRGALDARLRRNAVELTAGSARISAQMSGRIQVQGEAPHLKVSAALTGNAIRVHGAGIDLKPFEADVHVSGTYPNLLVNNLSARIAEASTLIKGKTYSLRDIHLKMAEGRINVADEVVSLPQIHLNAGRLRHLKASVDMQPKEAQIHIQGKKTGVAGWAGDQGLLPDGWQIAGADAVDLHMDVGRNMDFHAEISFPSLAFENDAATVLGDKLALNASVKGTANRKAGRVRATAALKADQGEVLVDRFYVNLNQYPLRADLKAIYQLRKQAFYLSPFECGLGALFTCRATGRIVKRAPHWDFDLSVHMPETPLNPLFRLFVAEPFEMETPFLRGIRMGGHVAAGVALKGRAADWEVKGDVRWTDGTMSSESKGLSLSGVELSCPVWLQQPHTDAGSQVHQGRVSIDSVKLPFLPEQALTFSLTARPNRFAMNSALSVRVPGGAVRVKPITITHLMGPSPRLTTGLLVDRLPVEPLLSDIYPYPVSGTVSGALDPVRLKGHTVTSQGQLTARVFDGKVMISDPGMAGLFTGAPVFKLDARWKGVNLKKLTAGTEFGEIEGRLKGYARHVEIAQGQPQRFDLFLETVKTDKVPQRISVKAVDNIARLGGGQSPFVGAAGMFASLFKEFPYQKIGVRATLENDVFRINGTIHEDGKEYLVKRGLFSGVNVVNQNPDNRVSFKDMLKRLKRVTASKGGPVVK